MQKELESIEKRLSTLEVSLDNIADLYSRVLYSLEKVEILLNKVDPESIKLKLPESSKLVVNNQANQTTQKVKTVPKDETYLKALLERVTNPSSQKFLQNIINNNYPTLTEKQYAVVLDIESQV
jgi:hypothetical protein